MLETSNEHGIMVPALNDLFNFIRANEEEWVYQVTVLVSVTVEESILILHFFTM